MSVGDDSFRNFGILVLQSGKELCHEVTARTKVGQRAPGIMRLRNHFSRRSGAIRAQEPRSNSRYGEGVKDLFMEALLTHDEETEAPQPAGENRSHLPQRACEPPATMAIDLTQDSDHGSEHEGPIVMNEPAHSRRGRKPLENREIQIVVELRHNAPQRRRRKPLQRIATPQKMEPRRPASHSLSSNHNINKCDALKRASASYSLLLQDAFAQEDEIDESNWLTSTLIDLMLWRLATQYPEAHFLATDFCHLHLPSVARATRAATRSKDHYQIRDILGRLVDYSSHTPIIFVANVSHIHWNLLRVQFEPYAELQLFEPMGRLSSRSGISFRSVPRCVVEWLDTCYPQPTSWINHGVSAITRPQQVSGFDCGVACLLYADKCGQGQPREAIDATTDQHEITTFRSELRQRLRTVLHDDRCPRTT